ncbi:hypothetical protein SCLCIDRAFT_24505 [Scleroderma citrinum Foug A]|uniref:Uncharacterized protein n=1 Tax=Scleroderma citrinum Foug A TaxID=1036808 RepID=A0A0C2ZNJ6_9AGAM|nr:hypothetical protein SCLCIDRAFT_24505 [Scleroderma citrinum Foug A]
MACSRKGHSRPAGLWEHSAAGFADKEASLSPPAFTQFFRPSCVGSLPAHTLGPLPSEYVVDGQPSHSGEIQDHSRTHGPKAPLCIFKHVLCSPFPVLSITHKPDFFASTIMIEIAPLFGVLTAATQLHSTDGNLTVPEPLLGHCQHDCMGLWIFVLNALVTQFQPSCSEDSSCFCAHTIQSYAEACATCIADYAPSSTSEVESDLQSYNNACGTSLAIGSSGSQGGKKGNASKPKIAGGFTVAVAVAVFGASMIL